MKIIYTILFALFTVIGSAQNCNNPASAVVFQQKFNQMASKADDYNKYAYGVNFAYASCLTSYQVKLMATIFAEDTYRLEFCKVAYTRTSDINNFYDVYDAFSSFSSAFRLHDYVNGIIKPTEVIVEDSVVIEEEPVCETTSSEYNSMKSDVNKKSFDDDKMTVAKQILKHNCFNVNQVKGFMELFTFSERKLTFAQAAYEKCTNQKDYYKLAEVFQFNSDKNAFNSWLEKQ